MLLKQMKLSILLLVLLFSTIIFGQSWSLGTLSDDTTPPDFVIDYASTIQGYIEPCGCHSGQYGGIARRGTYLSQLKKEYSNLLVLFDGDLGTGTALADQIKTDYLFMAIHKMQYDAFNVGENEFLYGLQYLKDKAKDNPIFISANIKDSRTGKPLFPEEKFKTIEYTVDKTKDIKLNITIIGLIGESVTPLIQNYLGADSTQITIANPIDTLIKLMPQIRKKSDIVVVLAHMNTDESSKLVNKVAGIDILITGHEGFQMVGVPQVIERTIRVNNGDRGRFGGVLEVRLDQKKHITHYMGREKPMSSEIIEDTYMAGLVKQYKDALANATAPTPPITPSVNTTHP